LCDQFERYKCLYNILGFNKGFTLYWLGAWGFPASAGP
jgi:hypothetical protein